MKSSVFLSVAAASILLSACGYKGNLYLPKENDKARFGVIQTALPIYPQAGEVVQPKNSSQSHTQPKK